MEWVETTGRTVEEAKERALDQLGVDNSEADFEVLAEPKAGLFGRVRGEARVRARVRPSSPRPKAERRGRRRSSSGNGSRREKSSAGDQSPQAGSRTSEDKSASGPAGQRSTPTKSGRSGGNGRTKNAGEVTSGTEGGSGMTTEVTLDEQGRMVSEFLEGLLEAFQLEGKVSREAVDDEMIEVRVDGEDLGLLIGPKGQTLASLQELSRTVVQRQAGGNPRGRFRLDVSGYRQRRREALERFTLSVADEVRASGERRVLEPMGSADRKVVHDTANEIEGVTTVSEGEDPRRRVVILPAD